MNFHISPSSVRLCQLVCLDGCKCLELGFDKSKASDQKSRQKKERKRSGIFIKLAIRAFLLKGGFSQRIRSHHLFVSFNNCCKFNFYLFCSNPYP
ncbi:hypothetical protein CEXT_652481 [Caerostris extrusa]|uniref:Uncharacterized protein n=1 Tax=Caerostris extrusa TaxID=172846 RepID=A0AAV4SSL2_CAEEX|nr:hypothetical protein CEXT_652481 [Caerostris extrusa]